MDRGPEEKAGRPRRLGVFGGTFDPPHNGHLSVARDVADALDLDEVLWVVARRSPHKPDAPLASDAVRLELCQAAIAEEPRFRACDLELRRPAPSFTIDTLRDLRVEEADAEYFLILGIDQYRSFDRWRDPDEIRELVTLTVLDREGASVTMDDLPEGTLSLPVARVDISSTEVRERIRADVDIADVVPLGVRDVIEARKLYRD